APVSSTVQSEQSDVSNTTETATTSQDPSLPPGLVLPHMSDANALNNPAPIYPRLSRKFKEQGTVLLKIYIEADGSVSEIEIHESSGHGRLDQSAKATVKHWQYQPATQDGQAIGYWYLQPVNFALN
ncbi:energy transducer TonB, partial [Pseudoalteromonas maricaloris]|uniref:energy transducer TonB n=2 Tax=Pseudoalteromonas TaxID=53246 RepID=UPI00029B39FD